VLSIGTKIGDLEGLNDLERRTGSVVCVILPNLVALVPYYVKVVTRIQSVSEM